MSGRLCRAGITASLVLALALAASAAAVKPAPSRTYEGQAEGCVGRCPTMTLTVGRDVARMRMKATWDATCESTGGVVGGKNVYSRGTRTRDPIRVSRRGRFSIKGNYSETPPETYGGPDGLRASVVFRLKGTFPSRRRATGRFAVSIVLSDSTGATRDRCSTTERFSARRR
jgi:hypothetical protein